VLVISNKLNCFITSRSHNYPTCIRNHPARWWIHREWKHRSTSDWFGTRMEGSSLTVGREKLTNEQRSKIEATWVAVTKKLAEIEARERSRFREQACEGIGYCMPMDGTCRCYDWCVSTKKKNDRSGCNEDRVIQEDVDWIDEIKEEESTIIK